MSDLRRNLLRLASELPKGSEERKAVLNLVAAGFTPEHREKMKGDQKKALGMVRKVRDSRLKSAITDAIKGSGGEFAEIGKWSVSFRTRTTYLADAKYEIKVEVESTPKSLVKEKGDTFSSFQDAAAYMKKVGEKALADA